MNQPVIDIVFHGSEFRPVEEGYYLHRGCPTQTTELRYFGIQNKTSSLFGEPFNYGLCTTIKGERVPAEWCTGVFSDRIQFI